jgi:hypothetical protein
LKKIHIPDWTKEKMSSKIEYTNLGAGTKFLGSCTVGWYKKTLLILSCVISCALIFCCLLCTLLCGAAAGGAAYGIWYAFPYIPDVKQTGFTLIQFKIDPNAAIPIIIQGNVNFTATYQGRVPIPVETALIDVIYKTTKVAKIDEKNVGVIKPESVSSFSIPFNYQITSLPPAIVQQMATDIQQNGKITLTFDGTVGVKYILVPISVPVKFDKDIRPT